MTDYALFMLFLFLATAFFIRTLASTLETTYYWQLKEYRYDRMKQFILEQSGGLKLLSPFILGYVTALIVFVSYRFFLPDDGRVAFLFQAVVGILLFAESLKALHSLFQRKLKRPKFTTKALFILVVSSGVCFVPLIILFSSSVGDFDPANAALLMAFLVILNADLVSGITLFSNMISGFFRHRIFTRAQMRRLSRKDLLVIGVTGSFGKTSVKEFLSALLSRTFRVLKTANNINTEIGISETLLNKLTPEHQIFVAEMGAYEKGEIKKSGLIARPKIGVLTGLNEQHLALFGSLDKTFQAKWELALQIPQDGLLVVNGECAALRKRLQPLPCRMVVCFLDEEKPLPIKAETAVATNIKTLQDNISFEYQKKPYSSPLLGRFQTINLLMAIVVAEHLQVPQKVITRLVSSITPPSKTMMLKPFEGGFIIDDSYNVNPTGFKEALLHLQHFPDHLKIVFFPGIIELGADSDAIHKELGQCIGKAADYAFLHDAHFREPLRYGALQSGLTRERIFLESGSEPMKKRLHDLFSQNPGKSWVILFESRGAEMALMSLQSSSVISTD